MMEGRLLSVAIMGEDRGRLSDCATCGEHGGKLELNGEINQARHMCIHILLYQLIYFPHLTEFMYFVQLVLQLVCVPVPLQVQRFCPVFCTWLATVSASGAQVTVEPLATGVSTRLVGPRS